MMKKWIWRAAILLMAAFSLNTLYYLVYPDVSRLKREDPGKTSFMAYRERQWEEKGIRRRIRQVWVPLAGISPYVVKAVIIAEDDKFWSHEGFDFEAIQKALEKDLQKKRLKAGGSTISQQLAKNLYLTPAKNPVRKLKEAILTWRLERNLPKRRIIEIYLNVAEWGEGIFGIEAAARHYFGKGAGALSAREAAALAVVLPAPLRYNPVGGGRYVESRTEAVYQIMVRRGLVIPEYEQFLGESGGNGGTPMRPAEGAEGRGGAGFPNGGETGWCRRRRSPRRRSPRGSDVLERIGKSPVRGVIPPVLIFRDQAIIIAPGIRFGDGRCGHTGTTLEEQGSLRDCTR